jgi:putative hydrolase of the HAD superfamily
VTRATWLLCDYGEVLSKPPTQADRAELATLAGWDPARGPFWDAYWVDRAAYDRADLTAAEYWRRLLGHSPTPAQLQQLTERDVAGWLHPHWPSLAGAQRAGDRGLRLALFSNAPLEVAQGIDAAPWLAFFSRRFFSCHLRAVKPEPVAYAKVLNALGAQPEDVVFVDDRPANVAAAARLGIDARRFEDPAQFDEVAAKR